jgi:hypothetical protein
MNNDSDDDNEVKFLADNKILKADLISFDKYKIVTKDCCHHYYHRKLNKVYSYNMRRYKWFILDKVEQEDLISMIDPIYLKNIKN